MNAVGSTAESEFESAELEAAAGVESVGVVSDEREVTDGLEPSTKDCDELGKTDESMEEPRLVDAVDEGPEPADMDDAAPNAEACELEDAITFEASLDDIELLD